MDSTLVSYRLNGTVAEITLDDGKSNALSPTLIKALNAALKQAEQDKAVVLLRGREGIFSAGFDLKVLKRSPTEALTMLRGGFELLERLLSFPTPVVAACTGHAMAMGAFLLLASDYRIGASGDFKVATNEVAIGLTMPKAAIEICRLRLSPVYFTRSVLLAETFTPDAAKAAGFLDQLAAPEELYAVTLETAGELSQLDMHAFHQTKMRTRANTVKAMRKAMLSDTGSFVMHGVRSVAGKLMGG